MPSRTLIIGCGYVGLPLALYLHGQGHEISGWVHSEASATELKAHPFHKIFSGSVADPEIWGKVATTFDVVVHCASSGRGGVPAYEEVFLRGVAMMNAHQPQARRLFVSSTSVYGQTKGEVVTEESATEPATDTGRILRLAEAMAVAEEAIVVRSAGIYGPGRGVLWEKFKRGEAVIEGDGLRWINQIHRDDLVSALTCLISKGELGQIYNVSDDTPVTQLDFYRSCSDFLNKPMPPHGPVNLNRKRGLTNKRVSNAKLRGLGWRLKFPSFREGLTANVAGNATSPGADPSTSSG